MASAFVSRSLLAGILAFSPLPATWDRHGHPPAGGASQSPIDIRDCDVTFVRDLPDVRFRYRDASLEVVNTGSPDHEASVRATVDSAEAIRVGQRTYRLAQFHFHTPSEHLLDGQVFPMELHLVHEDSRGDLLVLGVFVEPGDRHRELDRIFAALPANESETYRIGRFDLDELVPDDDDTYRYDGSLTTSPYDEGVRWIVFDEPIEMSRRQIAAFRALFPDGNIRDPQPLNDRRILSDASGHHRGCHRAVGD